MALEDPTEVGEVTAGAMAEPPRDPPRPPKRERKPLSEEQARQKAEAMWLRRKSEALRKAKTEDERRAILNELNARAGISPPPPAANLQPPEAKKPPEPAAPAQLQGRAGWPSDEQIAAITPQLAQLWAMVGLVLRQRVPEIDLFAPQKAVIVGEDGTPREVETTGHAELVKGTAPLAAKYAPAAVSTPEGLAAVAVVSVFGAPLLAMVLKRLDGPAAVKP